MTTRKATHAGSWYTDDATKLDRELQQWLQVVPSRTEEDIAVPVQNARAIIAPHAGYAYSGETAAYAYKCIDPSFVKRIFILGPSHHVYMSGCAVSSFTEYSTPLGTLKLDSEVIEELKATGQFEIMSEGTDEDEHSIEMHLPYIYKMMESKKDEYTIVPILIGALNRLREEFYGKLLAPYLADPANLFIISSISAIGKGKRFSYTFYTVADPPSQAPSTTSHFSVYTVPIHSCIERLDREGMRLIEELDPRIFHDYLKRSRNTICGRHPIAVLLWAVSQLHTGSPEDAEGSRGDNRNGGGGDASSVSSGSDRPQPSAEMRAAVEALLAVMRSSESSVSYAAAYVYLPPNMWAPRLPLPEEQTEEQLNLID
ncbi:memo-like protein-domain-containing protein [Syncephalis fuscata]|nr:memo-like protein-domain-containing protein [Syncephalis fuscata]